MCPACLTSLVLWSAGTTSAGGMGWLLMRRARHRDTIEPADVLQERQKLSSNTNRESTQEN